MISFITNMATAHNVSSASVSARDLIDEWMANEYVGEAETAEEFLNEFTVTCLNSQSGINDGNLDAPLADGSTLSVLTRAVATGGSKGA